MKSIIVAFATLLYFSLCSKRPADSDDCSSSKRLKIDKDLMIYETLQSDGTRLVAEKMRDPDFADQFSIAHLHFALKNCLPDVVKTVFCEPIIKKLNENPTFCKFMLREVFKLSLARKRSIMIKILLEHVDPDYGLFNAGRELQTVYRAIVDKYIDSQKTGVTEVDRRILWLMGLHFSFFDVMYFWENCLNTDDLTSSQERPYYAQWLHEFLVSLDIGDGTKIKAILDGWDPDSNESSLIRLAVGEAIVDAGRYDLLPFARATFGQLNDARQMESYMNILKTAILDEMVPAVYDYIKDVLFIPSLPVLLSPVVDEFIDEADIFALFKSTSVFTIPTPSQAGFMRLASHVIAGDWRFLLIFMELHPNRVMIADNAWDILWGERRTDDLLLTFALPA